MQICLRPLLKTTKLNKYANVTIIYIFNIKYLFLKAYFKSKNE